MASQYPHFVQARAQVIAVAKDDPAVAKTYFRSHNIPFSCLLDPDHRIYDLYQAETKLVSLGQRPGLFVIDREGMVKLAHIGWQQWNIPASKKILKLCRETDCGMQG